MRDTRTIKNTYLDKRNRYKNGHRTNQSSLNIINILYLKNVNMNEYKNKNNMKRKRNFPLLYNKPLI